ISRGSGVMLTVLILLFLIVALTGYLIGVYNGLVRVRAAVKLAWSNIDVLLVQRHDELPKLVEVCKQYMQYEAGTLERVMRARAGDFPPAQLLHFQADQKADVDLKAAFSS